MWGNPIKHSTRPLRAGRKIRAKRDIFRGGVLVRQHPAPKFFFSLPLNEEFRPALKGRVEK
jgi:hypothetical protein